MSANDGTKYGKYFHRGPRPDEKIPLFNEVVALVDNSVIKESFYFMVTWTHPGQIIPSHGPHVHPYPEMLAWIGSNPDDQFDLGGEVVFYMGEEMEKHVFTQSTVLFIPAGLVHAPVITVNIDRPYLFLYTLPQSTLKETSRKDLLPRVPEEHRDTVIFPYDQSREEIEAIVERMKKKASEAKKA